MITFTAEQLAAWYGAVFWPLVRVLALFAAASTLKMLQGSSMATFAALGPLVAPVVAHLGLPPALAVYAICAGGFVAILPNDNYYWLVRRDALEGTPEKAAVARLTGAAVSQGLAALASLIALWGVGLIGRCRAGRDDRMRPIILVGYVPEAAKGMGRTRAGPREPATAGVVSTQRNRARSSDMYAVHPALLRCINTLGRPIGTYALAASRTKLMESLSVTKSPRGDGAPGAARRYDRGAGAEDRACVASAQSCPPRCCSHGIQWCTAERQ